jgi:hypothetical protein
LIVIPKTLFLILLTCSRFFPIVTRQAEPDDAGCNPIKRPLSGNEQERVYFSREFRSYRLADSMAGTCNNEQRLHRTSLPGNSAAFCPPCVQSNARGVLFGSSLSLDKANNPLTGPFTTQSDALEPV